MASASAGGVFATDRLYRDNALITAMFRGQDVVTLVVAVPLLLVGLVLEVKGSQRGRMLWLGMLFYTMYAYLFYAVAAAFNQFFLLYVATFGLPLYALLFSVPRLDLGQLGNLMGGTIARAVAIAYASVAAVGLGILWIGMSLSYLVTGDVPHRSWTLVTQLGWSSPSTWCSSFRPCSSRPPGWHSAAYPDGSWPVS